MKKSILFACVMCAFSYGSAVSQEELIDNNRSTVIEPRTGVQFAKELENDNSMKLLGTGVRRRFFMNVYAIGLYVEESLANQLASTENDADTDAGIIMNSPERKVLLIIFVRDVEAKRVRDTIRKGIESTADLSDPEKAREAEAYLNKIEDYKRGETMEYYFQSDGSLVAFGKGVEQARIFDRTIARALLARFIGQDPVDKKLKNTLLNYSLQ